MKQRKLLPLGSSGGGAAFSASVSAYLLLSLLAAAIISVSGIAGTDGAKYINYLVSPIAVAVVLTLALKYYNQPARQLLPVKTHPKYIAMGLLIIFGLLFSLSWVNEWFIKLLELMGYKRNASSLPDLSGAKIVPAILVIAVIPAVMEEILFRGIILNNAEGDAGSLRTIFLVGFVFSLYHGSVEQTIYQFICGCLFALLAIRAHSLVPSVIIHFINNALIIILYACGVVDAAGELLISESVKIAIYTLSAASLVGGVVWLVIDSLPAKLRRIEDGETTKTVRISKFKPVKEGGIKRFFVTASVGIAAMGIIWIVGLFL